MPPLPAPPLPPLPVVLCADVVVVEVVRVLLLAPVVFELDSQPDQTAKKVSAVAAPAKKAFMTIHLDPEDPQGWSGAAASAWNARCEPGAK
jgi:hypothetical protein